MVVVRASHVPRWEGGVSPVPGRAELVVGQQARARCRVRCVTTRVRTNEDRPLVGSDRFTAYEGLGGMALGCPSGGGLDAGRLGVGDSVPADEEEVILSA